MIHIVGGYGKAATAAAKSLPPPPRPREENYRTSTDDDEDSELIMDSLISKSPPPSPPPHPREENDRTFTDDEDSELIMDSLISNNDGDNLSPAEDYDDFIQDLGVWHTITFTAKSHNCSLLASFKFYFQLCRALDHDATIEKIMDTVHAIRDENDHAIGFKTALERALEKRKFLIQQRLWENTKKEEGDTDTDDNQTETGDLNVWKLLSDELEKENDSDEPQEVFKEIYEK